MIRITALALVAASFALPAAAQSIAIAQAAEQSSGFGFAETVEAAIAEARDECIAGGAYPGDCFIVTACEWAGWTADYFVQHSEGNHWHEAYCGLPTEAATKLLEAAICDPASRPELIECSLVQVWSPEGEPQMEW